MKRDREKASPCWECCTSTPQRSNKTTPLLPVREKLGAGGVARGDNLIERVQVGVKRRTKEAGSIGIERNHGAVDKVGISAAKLSSKSSGSAGTT